MVIKNNNFSIVVFIHILSLISLLLLQSPMANAQSVQVVDKKVEEAVLAEDWAKVAELLKSVDTQTPNSALRMIKGHACLALNRNNESLCLFLSAFSDDDLRQWDEWTQGLRKRNPDKVVSYYFYGDAKARLEDWGGAFKIFNEGLKRNGNHRLVLNARGVVYALTNQFDLARLDFEQAKGKQGDLHLADTHANIGAMWIQRSDGIEGAIKAYNEALNISTNFALALHELGCLRLVEKSKDSNPKDAFMKAREYAGCGGELWLENEARIALYVAKDKGEDFQDVIASLRTPGTTFSKQFGKEILFNDAAKWFNRSEKLEGMTWLPFNKHFANFFGNRGVERIESIYNQYGEVGIKEWNSRYQDLSGVAKNSMGRVDAYNQVGARFFEGSMKSTGQILTSLGIKTSDWKIAGGGVACILTGLVGEKWSNTHNYLLPKIDSLFNSSPVNNKQPTTGSYGGVKIDYSDINWEQGNWPFWGYYGLLYGTKSLVSNIPMRR